ncbi:MAG: biotin--[acetyl-CoA-carboxylase] ligase [Thermoplasmatales archaeon]|nr:biotin--[acetyl-CoA-carboxylase] ligase [Thermoplasmatales archaeon]
MKLDIIHLLDDKDFISGELISKKLNISRTAVWKKIQNLKKLGYNIESVKNRGYRLISKPDIPLSEEVLFELNTNIVGKNVHYFRSLESTNLFAKELIKKNAEEGTIVVSDIQTKGRGRKDRSWFSPEGGLWFSVILYPNIPTQYAMLITMATSISIVQAIKELTGLSAVIKWPNDLLLEGKKICGILTELDAELDRINYSVVGVGINVNNVLEDELCNKANSIFNIYNSKISRVDLLRLIIKYLDVNYAKLISNDYNYIRELWFENTDIIGRNVRLKLEKYEIEGIVIDIDDTGALILENIDKKIKIVSGDLEFI